MSRTALLFLALTAGSWSQDRLPPVAPPPIIRVEMPPRTLPHPWIHLAGQELPSVIGALVALGVLYLTNRHSRQMWDRQMKLTAKRERYEKLLNEMLELKRSAVSIRADLLDGTYPSGSPLDNRVQKLVEEWESAVTSAGVSRLFIPKAMSEKLSRMVDGFVPVYSAFTFGRDGNTGSPNLDRALRDFAALLDDFIAAAKADLEIRD